MPNGDVIDNRWVVPYSPYLLLAYNAHINVEVCVSPTAAKYLFKYIHKGPDRSMVDVDYDEVKNFQNMRSIGASEACWKILGFPVTDRYPAVKELRIHMEGNDYVVFSEQEAETIANQGPRTTELTAFFAYNAANPGTQTKYIDFPKEFTWIQNEKKWRIRRAGKGGTIGRIHTSHPLSGDE
ncbi:MAG: hypothetical protein GY696_12385 [Gammaproteobacteria bacterium]|nr:hypothetical protein [Gammaproteobacteria bacterium]